MDFLTFICYDKSFACKKAQQGLDARGETYRRREIKAEPPTETELRAWRASLPFSLC